MILITFFEEEKKLQGYCVQGHADYAPKGKDTVCASISALVIFTANVLRKMGCEMDFEDTSDRFMVIMKEGFEKAHPILLTLKKTAKEVEASFPKNLKVEVKVNVDFNEYSAICRKKG